MKVEMQRVQQAIGSSSPRATLSLLAAGDPRHCRSKGARFVVINWVAAGAGYYYRRQMRSSRS